MNIPAYQKYISQLKKVNNVQNLKVLHRKMHSSIMNSFANECEPVHMQKPKTQKGSSSFIFATKSPLCTVKSASSKNLPMSNKNAKSLSKSKDGHRRKQSKNKNFKRTSSKEK